MDDLREVEKLERVKGLFRRLDDVLSGLGFPQSFKTSPDLIENVWVERDLLGEYCERYMSGNLIDWEEDILPQAKYCFQLVHEFHENEIKQLS